MKRRKVGNLMALAVLSAAAQRPMHPYEMASALRSWGKEQEMQIKWGSFYTVVQNLAKHGMLEAVESTREGKRPERTVYQITEAGREELVDWVRELIGAPQREPPRFRAGLSVLAVLPPSEVITLLQQRLAHLEHDISGMQEALAEHAEHTPRLFLIESEYDIAIAEAEAAWVRSLVNELITGSFPGLGGWEQFHETGEIPPELMELADRRK